MTARRVGKIAGKIFRVGHGAQAILPTSPGTTRAPRVGKIARADAEASSSVNAILPTLRPPCTPLSSVVRPPLPQRLVQDGLELGEMLRHLADGGCSRGRTPGIDRLLALGTELLQHPFEIGLQESV